MAREHARLVVLGGPDGGREIALNRFPASLGRAGQCDITLAEEYISREHLAFGRTADGVVVEVLSGAGLRIGAKKYKKNQRILLGTGDVLKLGTETEILFVDVGDDTGSALAEVQAVREAEAEARRARAPEPPAPPAEGEDEDQQARPEPADRSRPAPATESIETSAQAADRRRSQRLRRILIGLGIYLAVIAVVVITIVTLKSGPGPGAADGELPEVLTREQIAEMIQSPPPGLSVNSQEAQAAMDEARRRFASRHVNPGDTYRCVKQYVRYKALSGAIGFKPIDQKNYRIALKEELLPELCSLYKNAVLATQQGRWHAAKEKFDKIRQIIPLQSDPIHHNVQRHLGYVKDQISREKKKSRRGPRG